MKNHDEFRRTVFEKAKLYEAKRKARNKKIIEVVSLCSLCVIIGISAYFGLDSIGFAANEAADTAITEAPLDSPSTVTTDTTAVLMKTTAAMTTSTTTVATTEMTFEMTTAATTTMAATMSNTFEESTVHTTEPTLDATTSVEATCYSGGETSPTQPSQEYVFHDGFVCEGHFNESSFTAGLFVYEDHISLESALETSFHTSIPQQEKEDLIKTFDEDFFEERVLIIIHSSDAYLWDIQFEDGNFTYSMIEKNSDDSGKHTFLLFSVPKDTFVSATLLPNDK